MKKLLTAAVVICIMAGCAANTDADTQEDNQNIYSESEENHRVSNEDTVSEADTQEEETETTTQQEEYPEEDIDDEFVNEELANMAEYIIPDSDSRYLVRKELKYYTKRELRLARNEIYARHGRLFNDDELQSYFNDCSWYNGHIASDSFDTNVLNEYEKANVNLLKEAEDDRTSDYILPESNSRYLSEEDLIYLSYEQLVLARNEIFARHGRLFDDKNIQAYFNECPWYNGYISPKDFNTNVLNSYEVANIELIKKAENGG